MAVGFAAILAALSSCKTVETVPEVRVLTNDSGVKLGEFMAHGPTFLLGGGRPADGSSAKPDVPSGVSARLLEMPSPHNREARFFTPASGTLQVVSVERPSDYHLVAKDLGAWRKLVRTPSAELQASGGLRSSLSEIPWVNGARCFHAKARTYRFPWGDAIVFLTSYVQGNTGGPVNNDMLVLVVQGFTSDGRYAVCGQFPIRHPRLPESLWDKGTKGKVVLPLEDEPGQVETWLGSQPDDAFQPSFSAYAGFLESLEIKGGRPFLRSTGEGG